MRYKAVIDLNALRRDGRQEEGRTTVVPPREGGDRVLPQVVRSLPPLLTPKMDMSTKDCSRAELIQKKMSRDIRQGFPFLPELCRSDYFWSQIRSLILTFHVTFSKFQT